MDAAPPAAPPVRRRRRLLRLLVACLLLVLVLVLLTPVLVLWAVRWWLPITLGPARITACGPWSAPASPLTLVASPAQARALAHAYGLPRWLPLLPGMWLQGSLTTRDRADAPGVAVPWLLRLSGDGGPAVARVRWSAAQAAAVLHTVTAEDLGPMHLELHLASLQVRAAPPQLAGTHALLAEGSGSVTVAFGEASEELPLARIAGLIQWRLQPVDGGLQPACHVRLDDLEAGGGQGGMLGTPATRQQLGTLIDQRIAHSLGDVRLPVGVPQDLVVDARIVTDR